MNQDPNFLIYLLKHAQGIGNRSILKILTQLKVRSWQWHTISELAAFAQLRSNHAAAFSESFAVLWENRSFYYQQFYKSHFFTILDKIYPVYLKEIYNPPAGLFFEGDLTLLHTTSVSIVGTRKFSTYGKCMVEKIVPELCQARVTIVSGLARGIDTFAHQLAIRAKGRTIAVIGSGIDISYPKENQRLQEYIAQNHLLLSEYPSGSRPLTHHFPERNRIIAGISRGTCVIEAKKQSGSLITAQLALDSGRDVFAVPGQANIDISEGCHELIQQGAKCVWTAPHILEELRF